MYVLSKLFTNLGSETQCSRPKVNIPPAPKHMNTHVALSVVALTRATGGSSIVSRSSVDPVPIALNSSGQEQQDVKIALSVVIALKLNVRRLNYNDHLDKTNTIK